MRSRSLLTRGALQVTASLSDYVFGPAIEAAAQGLARELRLPAHFVELLLAIEDKRFQYHAGVDPIAVVRALIFNVGTRTSRPHGASTLTQQIYSADARRRRQYEPTLRFKIAQTVWAIQKTFASSKSSTLQEYLETVYFGKSYYGLAGAARAYCDKVPTQLGIADSFFLVERIATPNRANLARVRILAARRPVAAALQFNPGVVPELAILYERHFGCGEAIARCLERSLKRSVVLTSTSLADALNVQ
jgi:hypothetical protein